MAEKQYIERRAAIEQTRLLYCKECNSYNGIRCRACELDNAMLLMEEIPAADVVEVVHAEWIYHECVSFYEGTKSGYSCSACNAFVDEEVFEIYEIHKNFCGNCGAKMDGKRKEQQ